MINTHEPSSLLQFLGRTTAQFPRMFVDIKVCLRKQVLDFVDFWLQFSVFKDRRIAGRAKGHGGKEDDSSENAWQLLWDKPPLGKL